MIKQNPFSLYDFLGYFIPGVLLLDCLIFINISDFSNLELSITAFILNDDNLNFQNILFFIIICYVLGHFINFISSIFVERFANWIYDYPSKYLLKIQKKFSYKTITPKRIFIWIIVLPVSILDLLMGQLLKVRRLYTNGLDPLLIHCIKQKGLKLINRHFKADGNDEIKKINDYDFFRIFHHYVFEHSKNHQFKMSNYVVLYGFLRSLTMISVVIFWYLLYLKFIDFNKYITYYHIAIISILSYAFFMAFMKFYRRYTLETLMLIAISEDLTTT